MITLIEWLARLVLVALGGLSIWSVTIIVERRRFFSALPAQNDLQERLKRRDLEGFKQGLGTIYPFAKPFFSQAEELADPALVDRAFSAAAIEAKKLLERRIAILGTLGATTPFLGLLGTVMGIIVSFGKLSQGGGGTDVVMFSLAEALILTAVGLLVAIPAVVAFNYFSRRTKGVLNDLSALKDLYLTYRS